MTISDETAKQYLGRVREKYARAGRAAPTKLECIVEPSRTGISFHLPDCYSPPCGLGARTYPSSDFSLPRQFTFSGQLRYDPYSGVITQRNHKATVRAGQGSRVPGAGTTLRSAK